MLKASTSALLLALNLVALSGASFAQSLDEARQRVFDENDRTLECCDTTADFYYRTIDDGVMASDIEDESE